MSAQPFLICALPRSRTAWLANLLTYDGSSCGHEMMADYPKPEQLAQVLTGSPAVCAGNADTSQCLKIDALMAAMPGVKVAAIMRPVDEVVKSLLNAGIEVKLNQLQPLVNAMHRIAAMPDVLTVNFSDLHDEGACEALANHLTPGIWWDFRRWKMLDSLKIEITPNRWRELFQRARENVLEN